MTLANPTTLFPTAPAVSPHSAAVAAAHRPQGLAGGVRVGDTERTRVCDLLATHFAEGRLSPIELDVRLAAATSAVTQGDLTGLLADLPREDGYRLQPQPVAYPAATPRSAVTGIDILLGVGVLGAFGLIAMMMLGIGIVSPPMFVASFFGGLLALLLGGGVVHLMHRAYDRRRPPQPDWRTA